MDVIVIKHDAYLQPALLHEIHGCYCRKVLMLTCSQYCHMSSMDVIVVKCDIYLQPALLHEFHGRYCRKV